MAARYIHLSDRKEHKPVCKSKAKKAIVSTKEFRKLPADKRCPECVKIMNEDIRLDIEDNVRRSMHLAIAEHPDRCFEYTNAQRVLDELLHKTSLSLIDFGEYWNSIFPEERQELVLNFSTKYSPYPSEYYMRMTGIWPG